jgi:isopentenyl-diphosphate delta-isomerase
VARRGSIWKRKADHLRICTSTGRYAVESGSTWLDQVQLVHSSLPEISAGQIDTTAVFLGRPVSMPIFISSMTGGSEKAYQANRNLAQAAQNAGIAVGTGSIRILLRKPEVISHFMMRDVAPDIPIFANIGGVQLVSDDQEPVIELVKRLEVDGIAVHLNPGQELVQPEGETHFSGVLAGIARFCEASPVPVIVKETGFGINPIEAKALVDVGVNYVDVAGSGGTNWALVEGYRLPRKDRALAEELNDWGLPTGLLVAACRDLDGSVLASGGLRGGIDAAKSIALGAVGAGFALPFIRAVLSGGVDAAGAYAERLRDELHAALLLTGCGTVDELRKAPVVESVGFSHAKDQLRAMLGDA